MGRHRTDAMRAAYVEELEAQLVSWVRMAALVVAILFLCTGVATLLLTERDRVWLVGARGVGSVTAFAGYLVLGRPSGRRHMRLVVFVATTFILTALATVCWRAGGINSIYANSAHLAYMMTLLIPTLRWVLLPLIGAFLVAMVIGARLATPSVPWSSISILTIYHLATLGMFIFGGYLMDRFRFRAFAARYRLRQFLPSTVAKGIASGEVPHETSFSRQKVTVLFADLVSFTELTDALEPEEMSSMLNDYLHEMSAIAGVHGGTVDKFVGDAVMVVFGAPEAATEVQQATAAVKTATAMQERVAELSEEWRGRGVPKHLRLRIGLNTGYCTVGVFGSDQLKSYTAIGTPVNVAARLQAEAAPGSVLMAFATYSPIRDAVDATPRGALTLRGVKHPVEAFELTLPANSDIASSATAS